MAKRVARPVLVIEDDPSVASLLRTVLEDEGHTVLWHMSGRDGLTAARTLRPQMVLLDLGLPDTHGLDVLRALKADPKTEAIPVVIVSAVSNLARAGTLEGAAAVVPKPFDVDDLLGQIGRVARSAPRRRAPGRPTPLAADETASSRS